MKYISVDRWAVSRNDSKNWDNPEPTILVSNKQGRKEGDHVTVHSVQILDEKGNVVAEVIASKDGNPIVNDAKIGIITKYLVKTG